LSAVEIVSTKPNEYVVVADEACTAGEEFVLRDGVQSSSPVVVRIEACRPVLMNERVRFEVRLVADAAEQRVVAGA
jgi:hypothetical protein